MLRSASETVVPESAGFRHLIRVIGHLLAGRAAALVLAVLPLIAMLSPATASADQDWGDPIRPVLLPVFVAGPSDWQPQFPFPFDQTRGDVTAAEIDAEREMCQWYNAQYVEVKRQIDRLNNTIVRNNGRFDAPDVVTDLGIVTTNVDEALGFLGPRVHSLTQSRNQAGDVYFPLYQGDAFYGLWQQWSNVVNGLRAGQPTWFTGPSVMRAQHWGSKINRSHVCG
ncbi:hypothetical protein [Mycolicibacterium sp. A43C]